MDYEWNESARNNVCTQALLGSGCIKKKIKITLGLILGLRTKLHFFASYSNVGHKGPREFWVETQNY